MQTLLDIHNLSIVFHTEEGPLTAVDDVSFSVETGEVVGLVGESGCGKSVTALGLLRLIPMPPGRILSGEVIFEGRDLLRIPVPELQKIRGRRISVIFQEPMSALSPLHRIGAQLTETLKLHSDLDEKRALETGIEWLQRVIGQGKQHTLLAAQFDGVDERHVARQRGRQLRRADRGE